MANPNQLLINKAFKPIGFIQFVLGLVIFAGFSSTYAADQAVAIGQLNISPTAITLPPGGKGTVTVTCMGAGTVTLKLAGTSVGVEPTQVDYSYNPTSIRCSPSGAQVSALTLTAGNSMATGSYGLTVYSDGSSRTKSVSLGLTVTSAEWQQLGGALDYNANSIYGENSAIAVDSVGRQVVAFTQTGDNTSDIYPLLVRRWNGSSWDYLGGTNGLNVTPGTYPRDFSIAINNSDNPVVAWREYSYGSNSHAFYVKEWNGTSWTLVGNAPAAMVYIGGSLAIDNNSNPVVAYTDVNKNVAVTRWNGSAWVQIGTALSTLTSYHPTVVVDNTNAPIVAWSDMASSPNHLKVSRWNGSSWVAFGTNPLNVDASKDAQHPSLAYKNGGLAISWQEAACEGVCTNSDVYVKRWNGSAWTQLGGALDISEPDPSYDPSIALDPSGNPFVALEQLDASASIYVKYWDGSAWLNMGQMDLNATAGAFNPKLTVDSVGNPSVAWCESNSSGTSDLYVKSFTP